MARRPETKARNSRSLSVTVFVLDLVEKATRPWRQHLPAESIRPHYGLDSNRLLVIAHLGDIDGADFDLKISDRVLIRLIPEGVLLAVCCNHTFGRRGRECRRGLCGLKKLLLLESGLEPS